MVPRSSKTSLCYRIETLNLMPPDTAMMDPAVETSRSERLEAERRRLDTKCPIEASHTKIQD